MIGPIKLAGVRINFDRFSGAPVQTLTIQPPERVRGENAKAPSELVAVCEKAMSRAKTARYRSALALADDLQAWLDGRVVAADGTGALITARTWVGRNRTLALASVFLTMTFPTALGRSHQLQSSLNLANPWANVGSPTAGSSSDKTVTVGSNPSYFFRVSVGLP